MDINLTNMSIDTIKFTDFCLGPKLRKGLKSMLNSHYWCVDFFNQTRLGQDRPGWRTVTPFVDELKIMCMHSYAFPSTLNAP